MSENATNFGAIGEGRAIRKTYPPREDRDTSVAADADVTAADPPGTARPFLPSQPAFGVNICVELFGGSRLRKPVPRHSPCCKRYEYLRSATVNSEVPPFSRSDLGMSSAGSEEGSPSELSVNDSSNSPHKFESAFACGGRDSSGASPVVDGRPDVIPKLKSASPASSAAKHPSGSPDRLSTKLVKGSFAVEASRGLPDGEVGISDDFKQFLAKFKDLKAVWEEQAKAREVQEPPEPVQKAPLVAGEFGDSFDGCSQNVKMFFMKYAMTKTEENKNVDQ